MISLLQPAVLNALTGVGGAALGLFKSSQANRHELAILDKELLSQKLQAGMKDLKDARNEQSPLMSVGRLLCLIFVVGGLTVTMMMAGFLHWDVTVQTSQSTGWLLKWLYGPTREIWTTFKGLVLPGWVQQALFMVLGFYFGRSS